MNIKIRKSTSFYTKKTPIRMGNSPPAVITTNQYFNHLLKTPIQDGHMEINKLIKILSISMYKNQLEPQNKKWWHEAYSLR